MSKSRREINHFLCISGDGLISEKNKKKNLERNICVVLTKLSHKVIVSFFTLTLLTFSRAIVYLFMRKLLHCFGIILFYPS